MKKARKGGDAGFPESPPPGFVESPDGYGFVDKNGNKLFVEYTESGPTYSMNTVGVPYQNVRAGYTSSPERVYAISPYGAQPMSYDDYANTQFQMESVRPSRLRLMRNASGIAPSEMPMRNTPMRYL